MLLGTLVNAAAIVGGGMIGLLFQGRIADKYHKLVFDSLSLCVLLIGLLNAFEIKNSLLVIFSLVLGSILGQWMDLEQKLESFSHGIEKRFLKGGKSKAEQNDETLETTSGQADVSPDAPIKESGFSRGFVTTTLVYCIGSMAVVGSFESGLSGSHGTLFAKAALDGMSAVLFASSLGYGVIFSSVPVFLYQGLLTVSASALRPFITEVAIADMSAAGGLIIVALGLKMLEIKKMPVANMLPAIFLPLIYYAAMSLLHL